MWSHSGPESRRLGSEVSRHRPPSGRELIAALITYNNTQSSALLIIMCFFARNSNVIVLPKAAVFPQPGCGEVQATKALCSAFGKTLWFRLNAGKHIVAKVTVKPDHVPLCISSRLCDYETAKQQRPRGY